MTFRGFAYGAGPSVLDRRGIRADDLPRPMTNAEADALTRARMVANQQAMLRLQGFGEGEVVDSGDNVAAAGGASSAGFELGMGSGIGRAVLVGIGVTVGASLAMRLLDKVWGRR